MRKQMRDDAKRVVVPPSGALRDPLTRPPCPHIPEEPLEVQPPILSDDFWYVEDGCE
jgi:hypothetical protein